MRLYTLSEAERLKKNHEFQMVYAQGNKVVSRYFVIYWMESESPRRRLGLSASKKIGGAVARNRAKRLIREAFRRNKYNLTTGVDLVVVARKGLTEESYSTVEPFFLDSLKRIEAERAGTVAAGKSTSPNTDGEAKKA